MYYPYLRGKQFELIILRDNAEFIAKHKIHPIIEPVKSDFKALTRAFESLNEKKAACTLIVNPHSGQNPVEQLSIQKELIDNSFKNYKNVSIGYALYAQSKANDLVTLLNKYPSSSFSILHYGYTNGKKIANAIQGYNNVKRHIFIDGFAGKLYQRHLRKGHQRFPLGFELNLP